MKLEVPRHCRVPTLKEVLDLVNSDANKAKKVGRAHCCGHTTLQAPGPQPSAVAMQIVWLSIMQDFHAHRWIGSCSLSDLGLPKRTARVDIVALS